MLRKAQVREKGRRCSRNEKKVQSPARRDCTLVQRWRGEESQTGARVLPRQPVAGGVGDHLGPVLQVETL